MAGNRGRPIFRRTSSMARITLEVGSMEAPPPPPPPAMIGGEISGYDYTMLSPRYFMKNTSGNAPLETADFLRTCGLCHRRLAPGRDIYMYRGDTAFCSQECREQQMKQDERKERSAAVAAAKKNGESHHSELAATALEGETVAAA